MMMMIAISSVCQCHIICGHFLWASRIPVVENVAFTISITVILSFFTYFGNIRVDEST